MNSEYYRRRIQTHQSDIAKLQSEKARESGRAADYRKRSLDARGRASRASSTSSSESYLRDADRYAQQAIGSEKKVADIETKIARKQSDITSDQKNLNREIDRESEKLRQNEQRRLRDQERIQRHQDRTINNIASTVTEHSALHQKTQAAIGKLSRLPDRITVLFISANPLDQTQLRLDEEARTIAETIRKSKHRDAVELVSCWAVRPLDLLQALNEYAPTIVHFSGHGSDQDEIVFQDNTGRAKLVTKEAIVQTMAAASSDIRLVFFNTCYSRNQAEAVVNHVSAAIGMVTTIGDEAARVFAGGFYSAIGFGLSVSQAFQQARVALLLEGIDESDVPELFVGPDVDPGQLVLVKPPPLTEEPEV